MEGSIVQQRLTALRHSDGKCWRCGNEIEELPGVHLQTHGHRAVKESNGCLREYAPAHAGFEHVLEEHEELMLRARGRGAEKEGDYVALPVGEVPAGTRSR
jgi:hypothetical protein